MGSSGSHLIKQGRKVTEGEEGFVTVLKGDRNELNEREAKINYTRRKNIN